MGANPELRADGEVMENRHMRIEFGDGLIRSVLVKKTGVEVARSGESSVNEVFIWKDDGCVCMVKPLDFPLNATFVGRGADVPRSFKLSEVGPARAVAETVFSLDGGEFVQRVVLEAESKVVRFETTVDWEPSKQEGRRVRVAFPSAFRNASVVKDTPFAVVEGEQNHTIRPVNSWLGLTSSAGGAALIHHGTCSIQAEEDTMWMTLFRSIRVGEEWCPSMWDKPGDACLEAGRSTYVYWLYPFENDWESAAVARKACEVSMPVATHEINDRFEKTLPSETSGVVLEPGSLVVSAVKPSDVDAGTIIFRAYNPGPTRVEGAISLGFNAASMVETNFLEHEVSEAIATERKIELVFGPYEIKTVKIRL